MTDPTSPPLGTCVGDPDWPHEDCGLTSWREVGGPSPEPVRGSLSGRGRIGLVTIAPSPEPVSGLPDPPQASGDLPSSPASPTPSVAELARLRGIEEAARWHYEHSACRGWPQGEVLALALGLDPEGPTDAFMALLDALGIEHDPADPLAALLKDQR